MEYDDIPKKNVTFVPSKDLDHLPEPLRGLEGDDASPTGSFSITAEDAGRSRKSAVEAMGGEVRWGEWLDAAAA